MVANSRTLGDGTSQSVGNTKDKGTAISNSVSAQGASYADAVAEHGGKFHHNNYVMTRLIWLAKHFLTIFHRLCGQRHDRRQ